MKPIYAQGINNYNINCLHRRNYLNVDYFQIKTVILTLKTNYNIAVNQVEVVNIMSCFMQSIKIIIIIH